MHPCLMAGIPGMVWYSRDNLCMLVRACQTIPDFTVTREDGRLEVMVPSSTKKYKSPVTHIIIIRTPTVSFYKPNATHVAEPTVSEQQNITLLVTAAPIPSPSLPFICYHLLYHPALIPSTARPYPQPPSEFS